jgi:HD-like signal output (HDOD) protein
MKLPSDLRSRSYKCVKCGKALKVDVKAQPNSKAAQEDLSDTAVGKRIGKILLEEELITREQLKEALDQQKESGGRTFEILIDLGYLDKDALHACLSKQHGVASIDVTNYHVPANLLSLIPKDFARDHVLLPIDKLGRLLTIGMACPLDVNSIAQVENITGLTVKPMLCKLDDIRDALDRYFPEDQPPKQLDDEAGPADDPVYLGRIAKIDSLPGRSATVQQVLNIIADDENAICSAAELIAADACLTARVLSVANQPAYGMAGSVNTPYLAVTLLGLDGTLNTVLATSKGAPQARINLEPLWTRSLFAAVVARELAQASGLVPPGAAYTAGLLQDIGRFALAHLEGTAYSPLTQIASPEQLAADEKKLFGLTHAEAGKALAESWGLPADLIEAIATHDRSWNSSPPLVLLTGLAGLMADAFAADGTGSAAFRPPKGVLEKLAVSPQAVQSAFDQAAAEVG